MKRSIKRLQRRKFVLVKSFAMWNVLEIAVSNFHHNTNLLSISTIILFMCNKNTNIYFKNVFVTSCHFWPFERIHRNSYCIYHTCWANFMWVILQKFIVCLFSLLSEFYVLSVYTDERFSLLKFHVSEFTEIYSVFNSLVERISCIERFSCERIYRNL